MNVGDTTDAAALGPDSRRTAAYVISQSFGVTQALVNLVNQRPSFAVYTTFHHRQFRMEQIAIRPSPKTAEVYVMQQARSRPERRKKQMRVIARQRWTTKRTSWGRCHGS